MPDVRIKDLAAGGGVIDDTDYMVIDSTADGTRRVTVEEVRDALIGPESARSIAGDDIALDASLALLIDAAIAQPDAIRINASAASGGGVQLETNGSPRLAVDDDGATVTGTLEASRGLLLAASSIKTGAGVISLTDHVVRVDSSGGAFALDLPASPPAGWHLRIKDVGGACATNNVTIERAASEEIEGLAADYVLSSDFGAWHFWFDGTDYWLIGTVG